MNACMPSDTSLSMPIDGIAWSWRHLAPPELRPLLPFVMAADPSGVEALDWPKNALAWLDEHPCERGLVAVQCLAGLTLGLFFFTLSAAALNGRRLAIERLRWLELARPHRSLDALLTILTDTARRLDCADVLIEPRATTERTACAALHARAEAAGFTVQNQGWHRFTLA